jgi:hypothetical protein
MALLHFNGRTYGSAYLITFHEGRLGVHTLAPSILSLLVTLAEDFNCNLPELGHYIQIHILRGCEMCPLEANFWSKEQSKVTLSEIQRTWWFGDDWNDFLNGELLHKKQCVAQYAIMMQKPLSLPHITPLPLNCIAQFLQNLHVEMTSNTIQVVETHCAPNRRCQRFLGTL